MKYSYRFNHCIFYSVSENYSWLLHICQKSIYSWQFICLFKICFLNVFIVLSKLFIYFILQYANIYLRRWRRKQVYELLSPSVCLYIRPRKALLSLICNSKRFSINIIQPLHCVFIHNEDLHLLLWTDLKIFSYIFYMLNISHILYVVDGT